MSDTATFNHNRMIKKRKHSAKHIYDCDFLIKSIGKNLSDRISIINKPLSKILIIGYEAGIETLNQNCEIIIADFCKYFSNTIVIDKNKLPFEDNSFDIVICNSILHLLDKPEELIEEISRILKKDGAFLSAIFGGETLRNLRECAVESELEIYQSAGQFVAPMIDVKEYGNLIKQYSFNEIVVDSQDVSITYNNLYKALSDLRAMGQSSSHKSSRKYYLGKEFINTISDKLLKTSENRILFNAQIIYSIAWKIKG